jgi:hypothetical protein
MSRLVAYELDGWDAFRTPLSGVGLLGEGEDKTWARLGVIHGYGLRSVTVTCHRHDDARLADLRRSAPAAVLSDRRAVGFVVPPVEPPPVPSSGGAGGEVTQAHWSRLGEMARLVQAAASDELAWEEVMVPVNGAATAFELTSFGPKFWFALGRAGNADVTIDARGVGADGTALVPFRYGLPPWPERPGPPAGERSARFPASQLAGLGAPGADGDLAGQVELVYRDGRLVGSVDGYPVDVELAVPRHRGRVGGTFKGDELEARWQFVSWTIGDGTHSYPALSGSLHGSYAGLPATLDALFHLDSGHGFDHGTVSGNLGGAPVEVRLEAADGGLNSTGTVAASGTFCGSELSLHATVAHYQSAHIRGWVGTARVNLDATLDKALRVTGSYTGPSAPLAAAVTALLWFT